jgi:hypothetical protein
MRPSIITTVPGVVRDPEAPPTSSVHPSSSFAGLAGIRHGANIFLAGRE